MRWLAYFILAYVMLGLQLGLRASLDVRGTGPDLLLLVVVFVALNAPRDEAMLGSFLLGAMKDLVDLQPMGLYALTYGCVALIASSVGQLAYRGHPLTQMFMTFITGLVAGFILIVHGLIHPSGPAHVEAGIAYPAIRVSIAAILLSVGYTTLISPIVLGVLQRMHGLFNFESQSRKRRYEH